MQGKHLGCYTPPPWSSSLRDGRRRRRRRGAARAPSGGHRLRWRRVAPMAGGGRGLWHISKPRRQRAHLQAAASTGASSDAAASGPPQRLGGMRGWEASGPPPEICVARRDATLFCISFGLVGKMSHAFGSPVGGCF
jgi:hypothetical protein